MKKLITLLCCLMMVLALGTSASAASDTKIVITHTKAGHTYSAYQIFKGELREEQMKITILGNEYPVFECTGTKFGTLQTALIDGKYYKLSSIPTSGYDSLEEVLDNSEEHVHDPNTPIEELKHQHMYGLEWGDSITDDGKALLITYYHVKQNLPSMTFAEAVATVYTKAAEADISMLEYLAEEHIKREVASNEKTEAEAKASVYEHMIENTANRIRSEKDARELANLLAEPYKININGVTQEIKLLSDSPVKSVDSNDGETKIELDEDGYYLVKDALKNENDKGTFISQYMVDVAGNVLITNKGDAPIIVKKVYDNTTAGTGEGVYDENLGDFKLDVNSTYGNDTGMWNDQADYSVGDVVPFRLYITVPSSYSSYSRYDVTISDTMSDGLTVDGNSFNVFVRTGTNNYQVVNNGKASNTLKPGAELSNSVQEHSFTAKLNLKSLFEDESRITPTSVIVVEYTAKLNEKAYVTGATDYGNKNTVKMAYSSNPNPGHENEQKETVEDTVKVFTYAISLEKVDGQSTTTHLAGAKFKLQRRSDNKYYKLVEDKVQWVVSADEATEITSTANTFVINGLDDGDYNLYETVAPFGYTLPMSDDPFRFTIVSDLQHMQNGPIDSLLTVTLSVDTTATSNNRMEEKNGSNVVGSGIVHAVLKNSKQDALPSTGGIGTTMFYVAGAAMVIGAGVLLVVKKRSESK